MICWVFQSRFNVEPYMSQINTMFNPKSQEHSLYITQFSYFSSVSFFTSDISYLYLYNCSSYRTYLPNNPVRKTFNTKFTLVLYLSELITKTSHLHYVESFKGEGGVNPWYGFDSFLILLNLYCESKPLLLFIREILFSIATNCVKTEFGLIIYLLPINCNPISKPTWIENYL